MEGIAIYSLLYQSEIITINNYKSKNSKNSRFGLFENLEDKDQKQIDNLKTKPELVSRDFLSLENLEV